ncbi:MAG: hypothetical protein ABI317_13320, partial [Gaiellales bacterium]
DRTQQTRARRTRPGAQAKVRPSADAESPDETLGYSTSASSSYLQHVKQGIAGVVSARKHLQLRTYQPEQSTPTRKTQARQAMEQQREALARTALERNSVAQTQMQSLDAQVAPLERQSERLMPAAPRLSSTTTTAR